MKPKLAFQSTEKNLNAILSGHVLVEVSTNDRPSPDLYTFQESRLKVIKDGQ